MRKSILMKMVSWLLVFLFLQCCRSNMVPNSAHLLVAIRNVCAETKYSDQCVSDFQQLGLGETFSISGTSSACQVMMKAAAPKIQNVMRLLEGSLKGESGNNAKAVLQVCQESLSDAYDQLGSSIAKLGSYGASTSSGSDDVWTWMSAVLTEHVTCMDELQTLGLGQQSALMQNTRTLQLTLVNSLALFVSMRRSLFLPFQSAGHRRLLRSGEDNSFPHELHEGFPSWISPHRRRRLLQSGGAPTIVVAQDGTGSYGTIQQAVDAASSGSLIYVKKGVYTEYIIVPKSKTNLVILGDGIDQTIITGNKYNSQVGSTILTATVVVKAFGFICKNLTIQNTAGPDNHQAVALLVKGDQVAFYKCSFKGYQDTLYAHSNRQFYRECHIEGTIDFVFGNAAAVFQQCSLWAKQSSNWNTLTAQSRMDVNQNTGFSFHQCWVDGGTVTYLGRPWKDYSRTVFMVSYLTSIVSPNGWLQWNDIYSRAQTVYYGEYQNNGDGSNRSNRVWWSKELNITEASQFLVGSLIGEQWLASTGITYQSTI